MVVTRDIDGHPRSTARLLGTLRIALLGVSLVSGCAPSLSPAASPAGSIAAPTESAGTTSPPASAATLDERLEEALRATQAQLGTLGSAVEANRAPGIAVTVITPDASWTGTGGDADTAGGRPVTHDTTFAIGSVTKTFVAALSLVLAEQGLLDLDQPIAKYLPPEIDVDLNDATVREVLAMQSGIGEHTSSEEFFNELITNPDRNWSVHEVLRLVGPPTFPAGSQFAYTNTNYILVGLAIEHVTGEPLGEVMRQRLLGPAGLERVVLQPDELPPEPLAVGYAMLDPTLGFGRIEGPPYLPTRATATSAWAAGAMVSDAASLASWGAALFGGEVLAPRSLEAMLDFDGLGGTGYGLGVAQPQFGNVTAVGHNGNILGFSAALVHVPERGITIAMLLNTDLASVGRDPFEFVEAFVRAAIAG